MHSRRELTGLVVGLLVAPRAVEAASKKPRFEEYVSTTLDTISGSLSSQSTTLQTIEDDLAALSSELDKADSLLGNTRLLEALQAALTEITTICGAEHG
jgi:hypothetical protein